MRCTACRRRADYHPEIDTGVHLEMVVDMAARLAPGDALIGFCALTHDLGKALTPADVLPSPRRPRTRRSGAAAAIGARLKVPADYAALAQ